MKKFLLLSVLSVVLGGGLLVGSMSHVSADEIVPDKIEHVLAKVIEITDSREGVVPGTDVATQYQTITATVLEGKQKGLEVVVQNDYINLEVGETFYLRHVSSSLDGSNYYHVSDPYRLPWLVFFGVLFVAVVLFFGGRQGLRGLLSLFGSLFVIAYVLIPGILQGVPPILLSIGVSSLIIILGSYITHGFNKTTSSAVIGMVITIVFTGFLAWVAIGLTRLTGFASEEAIYLNLNTNGGIDLAGLLLGGVLIGLLGVLYDAGIGQAVSVEELHRAGPHLSKFTIYERAVRIGREHIGALVNTLAIAYVGASLPLLLLYATASESILVTINRELFATEIIRTLIGSIGLVLTVPITTLIAVYILVKNKKTDNPEVIKKEKEVLDHMSHSHTHSH